MEEMRNTLKTALASPYRALKLFKVAPQSVSSWAVELREPDTAIYSYPYNLFNYISTSSLQAHLTLATQATLGAPAAP